MELRKVNGLLVAVERVKNTTAGNPRYEVAIFKDMTSYFQDVTFTLKTNSKGKHVFSTYNLDTTLNNLTHAANENFK